MERRTGQCRKVGIRPRRFATRNLRFYFKKLRLVTILYLMHFIEILKE